MSGVPPHVLVVFGATGDLAKRMLFPGVVQLWEEGLFPEHFRVIGSGRHSPGGDDEFRERLGEEVREFSGVGEERWSAFARSISFQVADSDDGGDLASAVRAAREDLGDTAEVLLYLSVPPEAMGPMIGMLGDTGLAEGARLILEKPLGHDVASARELDAAVRRVFPEENVFRIDHFLGMEAVRNLVALRFGGGPMGACWHRRDVASVQIDVPEEIGIEGRGAFMEATGTFRDMVPTHLCQVLGLLTMEPPDGFDVESLRAAKLSVFEALRPFAPERTVFGQYDGYRDEDGVDDGSESETFVALEAFIDNDRWRDVPFQLRTGKAMAESRMAITVVFRAPAEGPFREVGDPARLRVELSDDLAVSLDTPAKRPGPGPVTEVVNAELRSTGPVEGKPLKPYARLLHDALRGDRTWFTGADEVERLWAVCAPVLEHPPSTQRYPRGSWGPEEANRLPGPDGWRVSGE
ncbi:glucose-6-phosphate dehydrogenase [Amycolatopsis thailandensis]|uniref:Glucose-6-phosphate 1-dehydrogenase n=1 Tax=Amycolatopsis thailandensis TaxID=589330 RepID=A0A229SBD9_9PSEU|nr:glucose-6-phosphate dehydrogenase [Amycolatopsis thailandensis]OXM56135.1 glucose-6-phosphate dehydrogenase [Amycolatopsis thailandensis]